MAGKGFATTRSGFLIYDYQAFRCSDGIEDDGTHWEQWQKPFLCAVVESFETQPDYPTATT
jgi:hypothetical protein